MMHRHLILLITIISIWPSLLLADGQISEKKLLSAVTGGGSKEYNEAIEYIKTNLPPALPPLLEEEFFDDDDEAQRLRIISALKEYPVAENFKTWTKMLKAAKDKNIEIALIEFLGSSKTPVFTVPVAEKLIVPRAEVREKAAETLKRHGDDRMLPVILSHGQSRNPIERIYFLEALNHIYDIRFQKLVISMLGDENKSVRIYAIKCVNNNEIKEALPALRRLASHDDNNEARKMGIASLAAFRDTQSGSMLSGLLKDPDPGIRLSAIRALKELKHYNSSSQISDLLGREEDREIKLAAIDTLIYFKKAGNTGGLKHIIREDPDPAVRIRAICALGIIGEGRDSMDILKSAATDQDYRVRGEVCSAMVSFRKQGASAVLLEQIKSDRSRYVRSAALYSIVKINDSANIIRLFDIYSTEEDRVFREMLRSTLRGYIKKQVR